MEMDLTSTISEVDARPLEWACLRSRGSNSVVEGLLRCEGETSAYIKVMVDLRSGGCDWRGEKVETEGIRDEIQGVSDGSWRHASGTT
jgi:hypothetical protein